MKFKSLILVLLFSLSGLAQNLRFAHFAQMTTTQAAQTCCSGKKGKCCNGKKACCKGDMCSKENAACKDCACCKDMKSDASAPSQANDQAAARAACCDKSGECKDNCCGKMKSAKADCCGGDSCMRKKSA